MRLHVGSVVAGRRAVAAMEFGILAPVMALMVVAVFNLAKVTILWEQVWSAAQSIGESATTLAIPAVSSGTSTSPQNSLTYLQVDEALSAVYAEIPWVAAGIATGNYTGTGQLPPNTITAVLSSVDYAKTDSTCTSNCAYTTNVIWSKAYTGNSTATPTIGYNYASSVRPVCGQPLPPNSPIGNLSYGSASIGVADPFVMVNVSIVFQPWVFSIFTGSFTLSATSYVPVRVSWVQSGSYDGYVVFTNPSADPVQGSLCYANPATSS